MLTELTIKEFIHKVISNDPVPGGGSVSAFNGALADRKSTRLNSSHNNQSRMPSSA